MALFRKILRRLYLLLVFLLPLSIRWRLLAWPHRRSLRRLRAASLTPLQSQSATLQGIIDANRNTEFGRTHAFDQIKDLSTFAAKIPLRTYAELEPYIQRQRRGESNVITAAPLVGFALSGGCCGLPKPVPVTRTCLETWSLAEDMLWYQAIRRWSGLAKGCCLHLLPCYREETTRTTMPMLPMAVLVQATGAYLKRPSPIPYQIFSVVDENIRFYLILRLCIGQSVTVLRAASPGTLTILSEQLELLAPRLLEDLATGNIDHLDAVSPEIREALAHQRPDPLLARRLEAELGRKGRLVPRDVWPQLQLLICSTTGPSRSAANRLVDRFGTLPILDPGYRAAEGILTWPWLNEGGGLPALDGQYIEFLPSTGERETTLQCSELTTGQRYVPVITGPNGLYRYVMDDVVEVVSVQGDLPLLALVGRSRNRLRLESGTLEEGLISEAISEASRSTDVLLSGYTVWLYKKEMSPATINEPSARRGWFARLLRRGQKSASVSDSGAPDSGGSESASSSVLAQSLTIAIEPTRSLKEDRARKLVGAADSELRRASKIYDQLRGNKKLSRPSLLVVKQGTFSRFSRRRLAEGAAGAHTPVPALCEDDRMVSTEDIILEV